VVRALDVARNGMLQRLTDMLEAARERTAVAGEDV
jgi:hypothetical protein